MKSTNFKTENAPAVAIGSKISFYDPAHGKRRYGMVLTISEDGTQAKISVAWQQSTRWVKITDLELE